MTWKIGHRGASAAYPENTMLAFRKAIEAGADALEFDVHATKSGEAVIIHDETLERTTNGHGRIDAHTLAELKTLDAGRGERIPALEEALMEFAKDHTLFIEIKSEAAALPAAMAISHLAQRGVPYDHMPIIGFHPEWLLKAREYDKNIAIGFTPDDTPPLPADYSAWAKASGAWSVNPCIRQLTKDVVANAHAEGLKVITWTANTPQDIAYAESLGVDGIISDYPEKLQFTRGRRR